jgi:hypothetical protein
VGTVVGVLRQAEQSAQGQCGGELQRQRPRNDLGMAGYHGLTFDAVAARAGTSRSVQYRRWPDP